MQPLGGTTHVPLFEHGLEQHEQIQLDASEINFVHHLGEIISLASSAEPRKLSADNHEGSHEDDADGDDCFDHLAS